MPSRSQMQTELEARRSAPRVMPLTTRQPTSHRRVDWKGSLRRHGMYTPPPGRRGSRLCQPPLLAGAVYAAPDGSYVRPAAGALTGSHKHSPTEDAPLPGFPILVVGLALGPKRNWLVLTQTHSLFSLLPRCLNHWPTQTETFCPSMKAWPSIGIQRPRPRISTARLL